MLRRPRFERQPAALVLQLTPRDLEILQHVARHRFLNSQQIIQIVGGSRQHVLRRLQRLFHHGYLDRPRAQVRYFSKEGSLPLAYALGSAGSRELTTSAAKRPRHDNSSVKHLYLEHTLLVAEVMLAFERSCRTPGAPRLVTEEEIAPGENSAETFRWAPMVTHDGDRKRVGVVPDRTFALESPVTGERVLYFLEADRATMPIARRTLHQSSFFRKLLAYEATWAQGLHRDRFKCDRFRVLTVTSSPQRALNLAGACDNLTRGRGLFLFTNSEALRASPDVFSHPWRNAHGENEYLAAA